MSANTSNRGYTYPQSTDHNRIWEHIQELADDIDSDVESLANPASNTGSSVFTPAANFTLVSAIGRTALDGAIVEVRVELTYTGANIVPTGTANITDTSCGTIAASYRPADTRNVVFGTANGNGEMQIGSDGNCVLRAYDATLGSGNQVRWNMIALRG